MGGIGRAIDPTTKRGLLNLGTGGAYEASDAVTGGRLGGGGKGSGAPGTPDFAAAVDRQAASGHVDQTNPFGSTAWEQTPDGRWVQTTQLANGLERGTQGLMEQIGNQRALGTGDDARGEATDAYYQRATSRLDPQFEQRAGALRSQLYNQGLREGDAAFDTAIENFGRERTDAYATAERDAQTNGNQAQALTFEQNRASQMAPYQQLGALQGLTAGLSGNGQQTQYLPAALAAYQGALQQYGIEQAGKNSMMGGAGKLGAAAIMASDERLKMNVRRSLLEAIPGVPFASWEWKDAPGERHVGVIAQDVERVAPELVLRDPRGFRMVDYGALLSR